MLRYLRLAAMLAMLPSLALAQGATIPQLPPASAIGLADQVPLHQAGGLHSATIQQLATALAGTGVTPQGVLLGANNLSDLVDRAAARSNLDLGDLATLGVGTGLTSDGTLLSTTPFGSSTAGIVPASGGGTANFLRADGTWVSPTFGGNLTSAHIFVGNGSNAPADVAMSGDCTISLAGAMSCGALSNLTSSLTPRLPNVAGPYTMPPTWPGFIVHQLKLGTACGQNNFHTLCPADQNPTWYGDNGGLQVDDRSEQRPFHISGTITPGDQVKLGWRIDVTAVPGGSNSGYTWMSSVDREVLPITAISWSGGTATATVASTAHMTSGETDTIYDFEIGGLYSNGWNADAVITVVDSTHFSYPVASDPGTPALKGFVALKPLTGAWNVTILTANNTGSPAPTYQVTDPLGANRCSPSCTGQFKNRIQFTPNAYDARAAGDTFAVWANTNFTIIYTIQSGDTQTAALTGMSGCVRSMGVAPLPTGCTYTQDQGTFTLADALLGMRQAHGDGYWINNESGLAVNGPSGLFSFDSAWEPGDALTPSTSPGATETVSIEAHKFDNGPIYNLNRISNNRNPRTGDQLPRYSWTGTYPGLQSTAADMNAQIAGFDSSGVAQYMLRLGVTGPNSQGKQTGGPQLTISPLTSAIAGATWQFSYAQDNTDIVQIQNTKGGTAFYTSASTSAGGNVIHLSTLSQNSFTITNDPTIIVSGTGLPGNSACTVAGISGNDVTLGGCVASATIAVNTPLGFTRSISAGARLQTVTGPGSLAFSLGMDNNAGLPNLTMIAGTFHAAGTNVVNGGTQRAAFTLPSIAWIFGVDQTMGTANGAPIPAIPSLDTNGNGISGDNGDTFNWVFRSGVFTEIAAGSNMQTGASNSGSGLITPTTNNSQLSGAQPGRYIITATSSSAFTVVDPVGRTVGTGTVGSPFATQIGFTITGTPATNDLFYFDVGALGKTEQWPVINVQPTMQAGSFNVLGPSGTNLFSVSGLGVVKVGGTALATVATSASASDLTAGTLAAARFPNSTGVTYDFSGATDSMLRPAGTTAQRPSTPVAGMERYNTTLAAVERYSGASSSWRVYGGSYVLAQSGAAGVSTASATEANLAAIKIPGNMMGANGMVRLTTLWSYPNSSNTKTLIVRASTSSGDTSAGAQYETVPVTTTATARMLTEIRNLNATGAQGGYGAASVTTFNASTGAEPTSSIDTTSDWYVNINGKTNGTETLTLIGYTVEVLPW